MDDLFDFLIVKMVGGILTLAFRITWFFARITWWLTLYVLLSLGAGVAWLARGRRGRDVDTGRFGSFTESGWRDAESGTIYPADPVEREFCDVHAEVAGQYWRQTALARLLRQGALWRYKLSAITTGGQQVAAWCEFPQEARKNITLDHLDPAMAGIPELQGVDKNAMAVKRESLGSAIKHLEWLLANRGWERDGDSDDPANQHWYAARYSRRVISWNSPVVAEIPAPQPGEPQPGELPAELSADQSGPA